MADYYDHDYSVEFVPAGDGHYKKVPVYGAHAYSQYHAPIWEEFVHGDIEDDDFSEEYMSEDEEDEGEIEDEDVEDFEGYEPIFTDCHAVGGKYGGEAEEIEEEYLSPYEREILHRRQRASRMIQTATTAGGFIGGGAGSVLGEAISPTPGKAWNYGRVGKKALFGALAGGISPIILPGIAPLAAGLGGGLSGYYNAMR
jgi:hypothetical protein